MATTVCVDPDDFGVDDTGKLQIKTGCGLDHSDDGITIKQPAFPYPTNGSTGQPDPSCGNPVWCDPATGFIMVPTGYLYDNFSGIESNAGVVTPLPAGGILCVGPVLGEFADLNPCANKATLENDVRTSLTIDAPVAGLRYRVYIERNINGSGTQQLEVYSGFTEAGQQFDRRQARHEVYETGLPGLQPIIGGGNFSVSYRLCVQNLSGTAMTVPVQAIEINTKNSYS